jgi:hypothetical protein
MTQRLAALHSVCNGEKFIVASKPAVAIARTTCKECDTTALHHPPVASGLNADCLADVAWPAWANSAKSPSHASSSDYHLPSSLLDPLKPKKITHRAHINENCTLLPLCLVPSAKQLAKYLLRRFITAQGRQHDICPLRDLVEAVGNDVGDVVFVRVGFEEFEALGATVPYHQRRLTEPNKTHVSATNTVKQTQNENKEEENGAVPFHPHLNSTPNSTHTTSQSVPIQ